MNTPVIPVHPQCRDVRVYDHALYNKEQTLRLSQPALVHVSINSADIIWLNSVETHMRAGPLYMLSPLVCAVMPLPPSIGYVYTSRGHVRPSAQAPRVCSDHDAL
jgi:hypothetical protein